MRSKLTIALFAILWITSPVCSQTGDNPTSIVTLKNGIVYLGEVQNEDKHTFQMDLIDGNTVNISKVDIKRYLPAKDIYVYSEGKYHLNNGYFFNISIGNNLEQFADETSRTSSHLQFLFGQYFNPRLSGALGFSFEFNEARISGFDIDTQFLPLFCYGRYYLTKNKRRLFAYGRAGYGFVLDEGEDNASDHKGGFQSQMGLGLHFASKKKTKFLLSLGYHLQKTNGSERFIDPFGSEITTKYDILIQRFMINFAIEINRKK